MIIVMGVRLFTSRIILAVLGIQDYGIYTLVAGIVILFSFLNSTMSSATSRFLSIEIGRGTLKSQKRTFANALSLHIIIAGIVILLGETLGLWLVNSYIALPYGKETVANVIYQFALLTIIFQIIQVPYNASIISNERMEAFAILEVLNVSLILIGTYSVKLFRYDHLIVYSIMLSLIALCLLISYVLFCRKKFPETRTNVHIDKLIIKPMISFSMWDTYGNLCVTGRSQGINIINNHFYGVIINAASGIAMQVQNAVLSFGSNVITAYRPPIIKHYSENNIVEMQTLIDQSLKLSILLFSVVAVPIYLEMPFVLEFWLKNVPEYTCTITRVALICSLLQCITMILNIPIHATGQIKRLSFIIGTIILLNLPAAYGLLYFWHNPYAAYYVMLVSNIIQVVATAVIIKKQIPDISLNRLFYKSVLPTLLIIIGSFIICYLINSVLHTGWTRFIIEFLVYTLLCGVCMFTFILSSKSKEQLIHRFLKK